MSSYTMQLREIIEMYTQDDDTLTHKQRIEAGRVQLFDFEYPIFDVNYKAAFETNIIRKFYMREIGFETEGLFKFQLESWLLLNMPYFNKLFESELLEYDPLTNSKMENQYTKTVDRDETVDAKTDATNTKTNNLTKTSVTDETSINTTDMTTVNTSDMTTVNTTDMTEVSTNNSDNFNRNLESNNPDSRLAITTNDGQGVIEYASNIKENTENNSVTENNSTDGTVTNATDGTVTNATDGTVTNSVDGTNTDTINGTVVDDNSISGNTTTEILDTETYIQNRTGKIGVQTYAKMVMEFRESFLRIEGKIHSELQELFMLVY